LHHASAAIIDARVTASQKNAFCTCVQRSFDQLTNAEACRHRWVALITRYQAQPSSGSHFNHRGFLAGATKNAKERIDGLPHRTGDYEAMHCSAGSLDKRFGETFAAVRHWRLQNARVGHGTQNTCGDVIGDFACAKAFLESGWGDEDGEGHDVLLKRHV
jgi:hypothetical protein